MGWRRRAGGGKRDASEQAIVDALQLVGADVFKLSGTGNPDLLVRYAGRWTPLEVKTGKGQLTRNQQHLIWPVARTVEQALIVVGVPPAARSNWGFE